MTVREYDCTKCGACCARFTTAHTDPPTVTMPLTQRDRDRFSLPVLSELVYDPEGRNFGESLHDSRWLLQAKRLEDGTLVCTHFEGKIGGPCSCSIYEERPYHCKWFASDPDNRACYDSRVELGVEVWRAPPSRLSPKSKLTFAERLRNLRASCVGPKLEKLTKKQLRTFVREAGILADIPPLTEEEKRGGLFGFRERDKIEEEEVPEEDPTKPWNPLGAGPRPRHRKSDAHTLGTWKEEG